MDFEIMFNISMIFNIVLFMALLATVVHLKDSITTNRELLDEIESTLQQKEEQ